MDSTSSFSLSKVGKLLLLLLLLLATGKVLPHRMLSPGSGSMPGSKG